MSSLICKTSGASCNCPTNIVANGSCDCPIPISGKEYYWDGTTCASALSYNQSCTSMTTNYMCQGK